MPSVKSLTMTYDALNERSTFSEGDALTGTVTLALEKEITAQALFVKIKGDAEVRWTTRSGDHTHTHSAHRRYFKLKQYLIPESSKDTAVPQGIHVYKFRFDLPPGGMPSSFRGTHGKIVYKLEAVLSRSWRMNSTVEKEIHFASKFYHDLSSLMSQQVGSTNKQMGLFSKGHTHMDVTIDRRAYAPGETMTILARINNSSSKEMTPKFSLIQDVVYHANSSTKRENKVIHKVVDNCVKPQTQMEVKCQIEIPPDQMQTIQNCDILSVGYHVKVYLDISFAIDPEVILPVIILHHDLVPGRQPGTFPVGGFGGPSNSDFLPPAMSVGPYPAGGFAGPSNSAFPPPGPSAGPHSAVGIGGSNNFPPPGASMAPYPAGGFGGPMGSDFPAPAVPGGPYPASPGNYGSSGAQSYSAPPPVYPDNPPMYPGPPSVHPAQPPHMSGSYSNAGPPLASPYGSPLASSSSSSVLHPPPSAPTFPTPVPAQELQPPPSYASLNVSPTAPTFSLLPSAPMMNTNFLSQSDEAPPAYSPSFLSSDTKGSDTKK